MIQTGLVGLDTSHPMAFGEYMKQSGRMRYAGVYNDGFRCDAEVDGFMHRFAVQKRFGSIAEMAKAVDVGFVQSCNWDNHIEQAMPFIEQGKPVFIDKPLCGCAEDCDRLEKLAATSVILGSSSVRYAAEIDVFLKQNPAERGEVLHIFGTVGVDDFNYAIHIVEGLCALADANVVAARWIGESTRQGVTCDVYTLRFDNNVRATYAVCLAVWQPFEFLVTTTKSTYPIGIDADKLYGSLLNRVYGTLAGGENTMASVTSQTNAVRAMLAAKASKAAAGAEIALAAIPAGVFFDGSAFEESYSAAAAPLYR